MITFAVVMHVCSGVRSCETETARVGKAGGGKEGGRVGRSGLSLVTPVQFTTHLGLPDQVHSIVFITTLLFN